MSDKEDLLIALKERAKFCIECFEDRVNPLGGLLSLLNISLNANGFMLQMHSYFPLSFDIVDLYQMEKLKI